MARLIEQMPSRYTIVQALEQSGFTTIYTEAYEVRRDLQDFFLYSGKHRPEMSLDPGVRAAISTFAALADVAEVEDGCRKLSRDIAADRIVDVIASYRHAQGDYLFVVGEQE
jgi:hypothetical protein